MSFDWLLPSDLGPTMTEASLLKDDGLLAQLVADVGEEALPVLLASFEREIEKSRRTIVECLKEQNIELLEITAHAFKSVSFTFGACRLGDMCRAIEQAAKEGKPLNQIGAQVEEMETIIDDTLEAFGF